MKKKHLQPLTPAGLYARVSSERQDVDLSVSAQLRALKDYARANGYSVAREYMDEAESGRVADRPQFREMIEEGGKPKAPFDVILVWKFSRFTRKREHAVAFKSMLRRKGIRVVSITEQAEDNATGRLLEGIIESVDEFYSENLVWGTRAKDAAPPVRVEDAHPAIVSKRQFRRVNKLLGSRAPKKVHPRRSASPYLLRCETCGKAMTAAEAKNGKYTYYVCHSLLKRGSGTCKTPRLNAKSFEKLIVDEIRANVLTESNIRDLVKLLDEEMDGVAAEQRQRLETIEEELEDVKRRLGRIWQVIETTDIEMADASERIKEHRDRKEKLEVAAGEARALLSERRQFLDSADTIATFAAEMSEFLKTSELTETRAFVHSFVKEVEVKPGKAAIIYSIPTPEDSPIGGADAAEVALNGRVRSTVQSGGRALPAPRLGQRLRMRSDPPAAVSRADCKQTQSVARVVSASLRRVRR